MTSLNFTRVICYFLAAVAAVGCNAKALQKASPSSSEATESLEKQARAALAQNRPADAIALFQKGVRLDPGWQEGWWGLGMLLYQADRYTLARQALSHLVELDPKNGPAWAVLGLCDFELRDYGASRDHLERGLGLGIPPALELTDVARYHEALALIAAKKYEEAQFVLNNFVRRGLHSDEVVVAFGLAALHIAAWPPTLPQLMNSDRIGLIREVGEAEFLAASGKRTEADQQFGSLLKRYPTEPNLHYAYGATLCNAFDFEKAPAQFRQELQIDPQSVDARLGLVYVGQRNNSVPDAMNLAQEAVHLDPKSFVAHLFFGNLLVQAGKLDEGLQELEISRDLEPNSSHVRFALAQLYRRLNRNDDALREQKAFERLKPFEEPGLPFGQAVGSPSAPSKPASAEKSPTGSSN